MNLKDFKVVIESKIKFADRYVKEKDYFYSGYISALNEIYEDILDFIKEDTNHENERF